MAREVLDTVVAAETPQQAQAAVQAIEVEYEELPAVFDLAAALEADAPVLHPDGEDYTLFGPAVQIYTATHPLDAELRRRQELGKPVEIGSDVWVGGGAIILPGVRIGSRAVIGAGSVVTRDVPAGVFAAGNPCRVIREIAQ